MAIIRKVENEDEQRKRCKGSIDTLEFSQAVSGAILINVYQVVEE